MQSVKIIHCYSFFSFASLVVGHLNSADTDVFCASVEVPKREAASHLRRKFSTEHAVSFRQVLRQQSHPVHRGAAAPAGALRSDAPRVRGCCWEGLGVRVSKISKFANFWRARSRLYQNEILHLSRNFKTVMPKM